MEPLNVRIVKEMYRATLGGIIQWADKGDDKYEARLGPELLEIQFHAVVYAAEGSGPELDVVWFLVKGAVLKFYSGSEPSEIARKMLAHCIPRWREHDEMIERYMTNALDYVRSL